ncbi:MAG: hypothetical protein M3Y73_04675 [Actinomycetota bacterium]|nr:hypothetical protein [Actinomycetota bacterium]
MTVGIAELGQVAVPFTWLGAVLAISFLETPLKFRAPGITVPLGLGIGRLVFRALNVVELAFAAALTAAMLASASSVGVDLAAAALIALWILLAGQVAVLRPRLDRRACQILAGETPPHSRQHLVYIVLEGIKIMLLPVLGVLLALRLAV